MAFSLFYLDLPHWKDANGAFVRVPVSFASIYSVSSTFTPPLYPHLPTRHDLSSESLTTPSYSQEYTDAIGTGVSTSIEPRTTLWNLCDPNI